MSVPHVCCAKNSDTTRVPSSALHSFLVHLPQPLGFRKPNGKLQYGPWEHACERLIRAEVLAISYIVLSDPNSRFLLQASLICRIADDMKLSKLSFLFVLYINVFLCVFRVRMLTCVTCAAQRDCSIPTQRALAPTDTRQLEPLQFHQQQTPRYSTQSWFH